MRSRIILFVVLAVVTALVGVYVGRSTSTPKAVGEPATATPADSSVGPTQRRGSGSGPARSPTVSPPKAGPPKATPPKATPPKAPSTDPVRFGKVTITPSDNTVDTNIAPARRALTTTFDDRVVQVEPGSTQPVATRSFAMTLPLTGGAKGETLRIYVQGLAAAFEGASARLTLRVNGQVKIRDFPAGWDDTFVEVLQVPAIPATTYQMSGVIKVQQDPGTNGAAYLNVTSVDVGIS